jgi:hypothetical protein
MCETARGELGPVGGRHRGADHAGLATREGAECGARGDRGGGDAERAATFRPDEPVEKVAKRMRERGASAIVVTTSDGRLMGLLYCREAERLAVEQA